MSNDTTLRARQVPLWMVILRSLFRRRKSLRWRTHAALRALRSERASKEMFAELSRFAWSVAGRSWVLPTFSVAAVAILQALGVQRAPLAVFHDERGSREVLGLLWQAEAAAVGLVLAGSLFAFESLTRQRSNLPLVEYANRSRLMQFLMLSASGLVTVPVALFATAERPAASASFAAASVALAALALLPALLTRAMRVVHPGWMQDARLTDIRRAVESRVKQDAFERMALIKLNEFTTARSIEVRHPLFLDNHALTETSPADGVVTDIDLDRLELLGRRRPDDFFVVARLGNRVTADSPLVGRRNDSAAQAKPVATVTPGGPDDRIGEVVEDLHEEALEAIRRASPTAAQRVMLTYAETWLAWPRAWEWYGQRLEGGLLEDMELFRIGPSDQLRRHVWIQTQTAVDQGFRDFVDSVVTLLYTVERDARELFAVDLVDEMYKLAQLLLTVRSEHFPQIAESLVERVWRAEISSCEDAARDVEGDTRRRPVEQADATDRLKSEFRQIAESLKVLLDLGRYDAFDAFDRRYRQILEFWDPGRGAPLAEHIIEDPHRFGADELQLARARAVVAQLDDRRDLLDYRRACRIALLGWILHKSSNETMSERQVATARALSGTLGSIPDTVRATGRALRDSTDLLSHWVMMDMPEGQAGFVDSDGPALSALAMVLLAQNQLAALPPADWMNEHRTKRLREVVPKVAARSALWGRLGERSDDISSRVPAVVSMIDAAEMDQQRIERDRLIGQDLDPAKVEEFRSAVVTGWRETRGLEELASRTGTRITAASSSEWGDERYGLVTLDPKGLFVSPTNWVNLEGSAREYGRRLAQAEISAAVKEVVKLSRGVRAGGSPVERLDTLLAALRRDDFEPSLIVLPMSWRLADALGLRDWERLRETKPSRMNLKGVHRGVPVIDWWDVPTNRMYALDLTRFCEISEVVDDNGDPAPPTVDVGLIDALRAEEIVGAWDPVDDEDAEHERLQRVLTSVKVEVYRQFRLAVTDADAARSVTVPEFFRA